jgi:two-component system, NtrC family, nitrogen regulation response regulator GlnG
MARILVIDDEQSICWGLAKLGRQLGHAVATAGSAEEGLAAARLEPPELVFLDIRLPGIDGLTAMARLQELLGAAPIIVITAYGDLATAVEAIRGGAFDYLTKPFELDVAERAIRRALRPREEPVGKLPEAADDDDRIVGRSPAMQEVFKRIALVAASDACVHLCGESGSGKELAARAIHRYSRRASGPFVPVHVASLSPTLAESELFGHVRGAFTGAEHARRGLLEQADGGAVFLDELADIPLSLQVKLLRALEHGEVLPVGSSRPVPTDFRIISATHQNLAERVADGSFRHDLYFRLITFEIVIPPLRERREDLDELAEYFLGRLAAKNQGPRPALSAEALAELRRRPWYGNVRELRNAIEHAMILARGGTILPEHLPPPMGPPPSRHRPPEEAIAALVRRWAEAQLAADAESADLYDQLLALVEPPLLAAAMEHGKEQCAAAARLLGLHRTTLRKKLDRWGIRGGGTGD